VFFTGHLISQLAIEDLRQKYIKGCEVLVDNFDISPIPLVIFTGGEKNAKYGVNFFYHSHICVALVWKEATYVHLKFKTNSLSANDWSHLCRIWYSSDHATLRSSESFTLWALE